MNRLNQITHVVLIALATLISACKGFVQIDPPEDQIVNKTVYTSDETATSAIRGVYVNMMTSAGFASGNLNSVTLLAGRSADEFTNYHSNDIYNQFSTNSLLPDNTALRSGLWQNPYKTIHFANLVIENLEMSSRVSPDVKKQLRGEALFLRAFSHFYLTNLFGDVPIVLSTDYRVNAVAFASTIDEVYAQMVKDLLEAKSLLSDNYPSAERIRANKWAAAALLSRVYLYQKEWVKAEMQSSEIIAKSDTYKIADDLNQVFLKNSMESILQFFVPTFYGVNTYEGQLFILNTAPGSATHVVLNENLVQAFEPADLRFSKWVGTFNSGTSKWYYPSKYKVKTGATPSSEYSVVFRLSEQYLIRSEARAMQNNFQAALDDLNKIRTRAGLESLRYVGQEQVILAVERERRIEFFAEWGHRWLDLKRTKRTEAVLAASKLQNWQNTDVLYPIPQTEISNNNNLKQNDGYN